MILKHQFTNWPETEFLTIRAAVEIDISGVGMQGGFPTIWLNYGRDSHDHVEQFRIVGTGHEFNNDWRPVGIIFDGSLAWHVLRFDTGLK